MSSATYLFHTEVLSLVPDPSQRNMSCQKLTTSWVKEIEKLTTTCLHAASHMQLMPHLHMHGLSGKSTPLA